jgi:hypothetical protein
VREQKRWVAVATQMAVATTTRWPGTDCTAHSLPSAVIDKENHTLSLAAV